MRYKKKLLLLAFLAGAITLCSSAIHADEDKFVNLKVLPKNISSAELSRIMVDDFTDGLGVSCNFCHAENKDSQRPDYASDENPKKEAAREMMRMVLKINKQFFMVKHPQMGSSQLVVTCISCHHGRSFPYPPE